MQSRRSNPQAARLRSEDRIGNRSLRHPEARMRQQHGAGSHKVSSGTGSVWCGRPNESSFNTGIQECTNGAERRLRIVPDHIMTRAGDDAEVCALKERPMLLLKRGTGPTVTYTSHQKTGTGEGIGL